MEAGNTSRIVVWLDDTVILKKPLGSQAYYFVADARTGEPIRRASVDLFGWRMLAVDRRNEYRVETKTLAKETDDNSQLQAPMADLTDSRGGYQWLITASTRQGRFAHLGFTNIWRFAAREHEYRQSKVYAITDRPVYRPGAAVHFKLWVATARYDQPDRT